MLSCVMEQKQAVTFKVSELKFQVDLSSWKLDKYWSGNTNPRSVDQANYVSSSSQATISELFNF